MVEGVVWQVKRQRLYRSNQIGSGQIMPFISKPLRRNARWVSVPEPHSETVSSRYGRQVREVQDCDGKRQPELQRASPQSGVHGHAQVLHRGDSEGVQSRNQACREQDSESAVKFLLKN